MARNHSTCCCCIHSQSKFIWLWSDNPKQILLGIFCSIWCLSHLNLVLKTWCDFLLNSMTVEVEWAMLICSLVSAVLSSDWVCEIEGGVGPVCVQFIYECNVMNDCNNIQVNVCMSLLFLYSFLNWIRHTYNIDCRLAYWNIHLFTCRLVIFACSVPLSPRWAVRRDQTEISL